MKLAMLCCVGTSLASLALRQPTTGGLGRSEWHRNLKSRHNPSGYRRLHTSKVLPHWTWRPNEQCQTAPCSEQVHLSVGKGVGEMVVQWTSFREEGKTIKDAIADSRYATVKYMTQESCAGASTKSDFDECWDEDDGKEGEGTIDIYNSTDLVGTYKPGFGNGKQARGKWYYEDDDEKQPVSGNGKVTMTSMGHTMKWWTGDDITEQFADFKMKKSFEWENENDPNLVYYSPYLYNVHLKDLKSNTAYFYMCNGDDRVHSFTALPSAGKRSTRDNANDKLNGKKPALSIGLVADTGQTVVAKKNIEALAKMNADLVLHAGDLSYAEGVAVRWDSYGRMIEDLAKTTPILYVPGNHDINAYIGDAIAYFKRHDLPYAHPDKAKDGMDKTDGVAQYWSVDSGLAHIIGLNTYDSKCITTKSKAAGTNNWETCAQTQWLKEDLAKVDRDKTPWVIVVMHAPFYNTNKHYMMFPNGADAEKEGLTKKGNKQNGWWWMKEALEPVLNNYGVDFVFNGHVHTYERMHPVNNWKADECGPTYVTMGDGGNYETVEQKWMNDEETGEPPQWSAFREGSFGVGSLHIMDSEEAYFEWKRTACSEKKDKRYTGKYINDKGFGVDLDPECKVNPRPDTKYFDQSTTGSDSVLMKSKKHLGCPLKPPVPCKSDSDCESGNCVAKACAAARPTKAPTSNPTTSPSPTPPPTLPPKKKDSNTEIYIAVFVTIGWLVLIGMYCYDQSHGANCFGFCPQPQPPAPYPAPQPKPEPGYGGYGKKPEDSPVRYGQTESHLAK